MIYFDFNEHGQLSLRPRTYADCMVLRAFKDKLQRYGSDAIDIETELSSGGGGFEEMQSYRGQEIPDMYNPFGYGAQSYMPMPPDFSPQSHYLPLVFPLWLERGGRGGRSGGQGGPSGPGQGQGGQGGQGGDSGGGQGGSSAQLNRYPNENPRDTGRRDFPNR